MLDIIKKDFVSIKLLTNLSNNVKKYFKNHYTVVKMKKNIEKNRNKTNDTDRSNDKKLDRVDCLLIRLLQKDGRMPNNAIAQELGISEFTVRRRLKRLLDSGIIKIVAVANPMDLGFEIAGNLKIRIDLKKADDVLEKLKKLDALIWVALTTGGTDIDVDFVVRSLKEFQELVFKKISKIDGVLSTEASLMVDLVKDEHDWGTAWD
jgi:Lrp/AsnC family transcriptional regulator for asnA, asnC and gidA